MTSSIHGENSVEGAYYIFPWAGVSPISSAFLQNFSRIFSSVTLYLIKIKALGSKFGHKCL